MNLISTATVFGGQQKIFTHPSEACRCDMRFAVYTPPEDRHGSGPFPAIFWLSGLTCTEENFIVKAGAQRIAAELGLVLIAPDTSPRGEGVPDDPVGAYDFGLGAGFYVNATQAPWSTHYQMRRYIEEELYDLVLDQFPVDPARIGVTGHSMGGHGALTIGLRNPKKFRSISAFAPISSPVNCPWGEKALDGYLGEGRGAWRDYDACALLEDGARAAALLVDQGAADTFLEAQLKPELLQAACEKAGVPLNLRMQPGYDHSYYFIASFIEDHLRWHVERLS